MAHPIRSFPFKALSPDAQLQIACCTDINTLAAFSATCRILNQATQAPLLFVKVRLGKSALALPEVPAWTRPWLEALVRGVVSRTQRDSNAGPRASIPLLKLPPPATVKRHVRSASQPLAQLPSPEPKGSPVEVRKSTAQSRETPRSPRTKRQEQDRDRALALTTRRLGVGFLGSARDAMKALVSEFDLLLGDLGAESQELLDRVLERAAAPEEWQSKSSDAMQAHATLLRKIGCAFFTQRKDRKNEVALFRDASLNALRVFIVALNESRDFLDRKELGLFCGEVLRMLALGSSARQCRLMPANADLRQLFVDTGLLSETEWQDIAQRAIGRRDECLSYSDLIPAQEQITEADGADDLPARRGSDATSPQSRRKKRGASMHSGRPEPKENCAVS